MDAPLIFRADVWQHFGFPVSRNDSGKKETDKSKTICKYCHTAVSYNMGNASNMRSHVACHHPEKLRPQSQQQPSARPEDAFGAPLPQNSPRAEEITRCISEYIAKDLRPFSVVDNNGFRRSSLPFHHSHTLVAQCSQLCTKRQKLK